MAKSNKEKPVSVRLERISAAIAYEISQVILRDMDDKRIKHALISRVSVTKDLSIAKVYFTVADPSIDTTQLAKLLNKISGTFRHHIAQTLQLRVTPEIKFYFDEDATKAQHLLELIEKL